MFSRGRLPAELLSARGTSTAKAETPGAGSPLSSEDGGRLEGWVGSRREEGARTLLGGESNSAVPGASGAARFAAGSGQPGTAAWAARPASQRARGDCEAPGPTTAAPTCAEAPGGQGDRDFKDAPRMRLLIGDSVTGHHCNSPLGRGSSTLVQAAHGAGFQLPRRPMHTFSDPSKAPARDHAATCRALPFGEKRPRPAVEWRVTRRYPAPARTGTRASPRAVSPRVNLRRSHRLPAGPKPRHLDRRPIGCSMTER